MIMAILLLSCDSSSPKEQFIQPPQVQEIPGVELETFLVTKMSSGNYPQDRVNYIGEPVKIFHVYNQFSKIPEGSHMYEYALWPKGKPYSFKPKFNLPSTNEDGAYEYDFMTGEYSFNVSGTNGQNVWSTIKTWEAVINNGHGEYYFDTYLNGVLINRIDVPIYSTAQIDSLDIQRYWLEGEYFNNLSVGPEISKMDLWKQSDLRYLKGEIVSIPRPANYKGFNRFFAVQKVPETKDEYALVEVKKQEPVEIRRIKTSNINETKFHMHQDGNDVYFFNYAKTFNTKYNLENGATGAFSLPQGLSIPAKGVFPSGKDGLSILKSCEDDAVYLIEKAKRTKLMDMPCEESFGWAGWSADASKVYFDALGVFVYDVASGLLKQLFYNPKISNVNVFHIDNQDLIMFSEGSNVIKVGTDLTNVNGLGFWSAEFTYDHFYQMDYTALNAQSSTISIDFNVQDPLLSLTSGMDMTSFTTEIKQIGKVNSGKFLGYDLLRMDLKNEAECKGCENNLYPKDFMAYFLSHADTLVFLESYIDKRQEAGKNFFQNGKINIRDVGYALNGFKLFTNAKVVQVLSNTNVEGIHSPDELLVGEQPLRFYSKKFGYSGDIDKNFRTIGESNFGDRVMVLNEEDGSFSVFHRDGSWSIYTYDFSGPLESNENIDLESYVHFTDRYCDGSQIDLSSVVKMKKEILTKIGNYSGSKIYKLNDESALQEKYKDYQTRVNEYEEMMDADIKSYDDFKASLPFFYWEDHLGRFVQFMHKDYLSPVACEPILYVYPEEPMDVNISVDSKVSLIASYPNYDNGWQIKAETNGVFVDYKSNAEEHRLFWEGVSDFLPPLKSGFVKHHTEIEHFLDAKLSYLGLNEMEIGEFKTAWMDELQEKEYCFIAFYDQKYIDIYAPIDIQPKPDQFIRILMDYKPLDVPIEVSSQELIKAPEREGFVVVEWGGLKR